MKNNLKLNILFLIIIILSLLGCVSETKTGFTKNGIHYGVVQGAFRHRWWHYYERGLSYAEGEFYTEALSDLNEAVRQREKDQRMARTYGMHFVDYFPHREVGVIAYQMGDLSTAKAQLELSLSQFPSAKASFYLDRVRESLIKKHTDNVPPPDLILDFKEKELWTNKDPIIISGTATDENYISGVSINNRPLFMEISEKKVSFAESVQLPQGDHVIDIVANNLLGKIAKHQVLIHVDRQGPMVSIDELTFDKSDPDKKIRISGSIYDEAGLLSLTINARPVHISKGSEIFFKEDLIREGDSFKLIAEDSLGNQTTADIPFVNSKVDIRKTNPVLIASADSDMTGLFVKTSFFSPKNTSPPAIKLKGWTDSQTVYLEKIYLEGQVADDIEIESVTIDKMPILRRKGKNIFFSHMAELQEGENKIVIEATDDDDNVTTQEITITRQVPQALQLEERLSTTVLPFEQKASISEIGLSFQDNLINSLVNQDRFRIVEREQLDMILQEQKLSRTALIDKKTAIELGKLVASQSIITGSVVETKDGIEIVARMIDTQTSDILAVKDVYDEIKDIQALKLLSDGMAVKFHREFPLLEGIIIQLKGKQIFTDLGKDKVKIHRRVIVYREEPVVHPTTGKILGSDNIVLGRAQVSQVMADMSKALILTGDIASIKALDKVITE